MALSEVTSVEVASAIGRKIREGSFRAAVGSDIWGLFRNHWRREYRVLRLSSAVYRQAERLVFDYPIRAIDSIHIATALEQARALDIESMAFWTADKRQARAAEAEGLSVTLVA